MQFDQTAHHQGARALILAKQVKQNCSSPAVVQEKLEALYWELDVMYEYQTHHSENTHLEDAITNTQVMTSLFSHAYTNKSPSTTYCNKNSEMLILAINSIMDITGRKQ